MSWELVQEFTLSDTWQYSQSIDGRFFRLQHINPPDQARLTIAQASIGITTELYDARKLISPTDHVLEFIAPEFWTNRRIAIRKNQLSPSWKVRLEVLPSSSPSPSPSPSPATQNRELLSISPGQTQFTLQVAPLAPHLSQLFVNGQKQQLGMDYVINGVLLQWQGYSLQPNWKLEIFY